MPDSAPPSRGVSPAVLVLSILLAVATTAAVTLALRPAAVPAAGNSTLTGAARQDAAAAPVPVEPFVQKDTVSPKDRTSGEVVYPLPYSTKPNLKLTSAGRAYDTIKADEFGFTWAVRPKADDFNAANLKAMNFTVESQLLGNLYTTPANWLKPGLVFDDFTWEAKGVRGGRLPVPFEQKGAFTVRPNTDGEVIYPVPYPQPAAVELSGNNYTVVTECRANGFKWKNTCEKDKEFFAGGTVNWVAKGLRPGEGKN